MNDETVRFINDCDKCGARLREFFRDEGSNQYPNFKWIPEVHELPDCIRHLAERIDRIQYK